MTTFVVSTLADENDAAATTGSPGGTGLSLREALALANAAAGADTITFDASLAGQILTLSLGELVIASDVTIDGDVVGNDNAADITIDANHASRVFNVAAGTSTLDSLVMTGGEINGFGGAIHTVTGTNLTIAHATLSGSHATWGGGISSEGILTLTDTTVSGNSAIHAGGINIYSGVAMLTNVSILDNSANSGGGAVTNGTAVLTNVTVAGNSAVDGGGIYNTIGGRLTVVNSTVSGNKAEIGGGIVNDNVATLTNSIIVGNENGNVGDVYDSPLVISTDYSGVNIIGVGSDTNAADHIINAPNLDALFAAVDVNALDVTAGVLADNGGPVQTIALNPSYLNPAIDAGLDSAAAATDARGLSRADFPNAAHNGANTSDIGAYEVQGPFETPGLVVTIAADVVNPFDGKTSLREALLYANSHTGADTITFDASLAGQILTLSLGELVIASDVTIDGDINGDNKADITVSGNHTSRVFRASAGTSTLDSLTITGGGPASLLEGAGVLVSAGANVTIAHSTLSDNSAWSGGGIYNYGTLALTGSTVADNFGDNSGGGLVNAGTATLTDVTVAGNFSDNGGGIYNFGTLALINTTMSGNSATYGGAIDHEGGTTTLTNSIVAGNSAPFGEIWAGSGIFTLGVNVFADDFGDAQDVRGVALSDIFAQFGANALGVTSGVLADNGGPVQTIALKASATNPAIDAGDDTLAPITDARGITRADFPNAAHNGASTSDIGAYELQVLAQSVNTGLTVTEGASDTIASSRLEYGEAGQSHSNILFTISTAPLFGALLLNGGALGAGAIFTQDDVNNNRLAYAHNGSETTSDAFSFTVSDASGGVLTGQSFALSITPVNDAPVTGGDLAFTVKEGGESAVLMGDLTATDPDNADTQLVFTVTATSHGVVLLNETQATSFTKDDIIHGRVSFRHDGGELDASFTVSLGDGSTSGGSATVTATVDPHVDDAPTVGGDGLLTVAEGGTVVIATADLIATDPDNTDTQLVFTVTDVFRGTVLLNGTQTATFTEDDVAHGRVSFRHDGGELNGSILLAVTDGVSLRGAGLNAIVDPHANDTPVLGGDDAITVAEGGRVALTIADLTATDPDTVDGDLRFTVASVLHGAVLQDGEQTNTFTKFDIINGLVSFQHDGGEDDGSFTVSLSDGSASGGSATVTATVDPHINDAPGTGGDGRITVAEGGTVVITTADLTAIDPDTPDDQLVLEVSSLHGSVLLNGAATTTFTQADIMAGRVAYQHDGSEANDIISVLLGDGTALPNISFMTVTVDPLVNDAPAIGAPVRLPSIDVNSGAHLIRQADLLANATDIDGPSLAAINLQIAQGSGTLADNHDGTWSYTPAINDDTSVKFSYQVTDGIAAPIADSATLDIVPAQAAPQIGSPGNDTFTAVTGNSTYDGGPGIDTINFDFKLTDAVVTYSGNTVIIDGPSSHTVLTGLEIFKFTDGTANNDDSHPLVDDLFYYSRYHDVWNAHVDADLHYNVVGWTEGRDPSAFFSTSTYLSLYPDVKAAAVDPLIHFHQFGWMEGRVPSINFDPAQYLAANPDVAAAHVDPLAHFLSDGAEEGRRPFALDHLVASNGFDYVYYLQHNPDVAAAHVDPLWHFETVGWKEGRNPNALFDVKGYLDTYADVKAAGVNPLDHYNTFGWQEGRDPSVNFDTTDYLGTYQDVAAAHINPLTHFLVFGINEGRSAFADSAWG